MKNPEKDSHDTTQIALHQFLICEKFTSATDDGYQAEGVRSNLYVPRYPYHFDQLYVVTCWRKDERFHKEVIEYETADGEILKTPHMDIEPMTNNIIYRWHTHRFPSSLILHKDTTLRIRVILDWQVLFESYLLIEKRPF